LQRINVYSVVMRTLLIVKGIRNLDNVIAKEMSVDLYVNNKGHLGNCLSFASYGFLTSSVKKIRIFRGLYPAQHFLLGHWSRYDPREARLHCVLASLTTDDHI
jgi:hypothetical protein